MWRRSAIPRSLAHTRALACRRETGPERQQQGRGLDAGLVRPRHACRPRGKWASCVAAAAILVLTPGALRGQVEAIPGEPFGVAEVVVSYPPGDADKSSDDGALTITAADHRIAYWVFEQPRRRRIIARPSAGRLTVLFLFRGDEPFDVTIGTPTVQTVQVVPRQRPRGLRNVLLQRWWRAYGASLRDQAEASDFPPAAETYLSSMLSRRLALPPRLVERSQLAPSESRGRQMLRLLTGDDALRTDILRKSWLGTDVDTQPATLPLPSSPAWRELIFDAPAPDSPVEPIALRVPHECFYVRFGQYANYIWFNALLDDYGGDIRSMVSSRGVRWNVSDRIQDQLVLEQGVLAELLGPQAISDIAMFGTDTFGREGAALGVLFEATGNLLEVDLMRQRQEALFREKANGATMGTVQIGGRDVSFLSTPDNRLRSYYLIDGKYQLVTNCRRLVERFLEVGAGGGSLGASDEFRHARHSAPLERDDTIFIYFSAAFFQNLLSPQYQIELDRRVRAAVDIEHVMLAQLAAANEAQAGDSLAALIDAGLLPPGFGTRPDGSQPVLDGTRVIDSLRGARGCFTPVPDVELQAVSRAELERYQAAGDYYTEHWRQMDPLLVAVKRYALEGPRQERITFDAIISPMDGTKYELYLSLLGKPTQHRLVPPAGSLVLFEASLGGGMLFPAVPPHTLFVGIQDQPPLRDLPDEAPRLLQTLRTLPGYLGAWPKPGFLDMLPIRFQDSATEGMAQLLFGIWRWQGRGFSVLAVDPQLLEQISRQIGFEETADPAHLRVHVGDLSTAQFRSWIDHRAYHQAQAASAGNTQFLALLTQQLNVPPADALTIGQQLLDAELVCPLGGQYQLQGEGSSGVWRSTAQQAGDAYVSPDNYAAPALEWFRGLEAEALRTANRLVLRAHVDLQRKERQPAIELPFFK